MKKCKTFLMKKFGSAGYGPAFGKYMQDSKRKLTPLQITQGRRQIKVPRLKALAAETN